MSKALECLDKMRIVVDDEWGNIDKDKHDNWYGEVKKELKKIEEIKQLLNENEGFMVEELDALALLFKFASISEKLDIWEARRARKLVAMALEKLRKLKEKSRK